MCSYTLVTQNRKKQMFVLSYVRLRNKNFPTKLAAHNRQYERLDRASTCARISGMTC
jgi:hypothetical protein